MTTLKGQEELDQFKLTKREVADFLGISTNAVRMSMRGNNCHNLEYRFNGKQFLFKIPRRDMARSRNPDPMVQHNRTPGTPKSTPGRNKKIYNRGATHRGVTSHAKHKKVLKAVKGYWGRRKNTIRVAKQAVEKAMQYAYRDRKTKKRDFRSLWIQRINAGVRSEGMTYSKFINGLSKSGVKLDRKVLADLAYDHPDAFKTIVKKVQSALN